MANKKNAGEGEKGDWPKISVVFPTMNRKQMVLDCVQSLYDQDYPKDKIEIIIADNASKDGSSEAIRKKFPGVKVFTNEDNLGSPLGINQCMKASTGNYILRLDDDMITDKNCFKEFIKVFRNSDKKVGAVAGTFYYWKNVNEKMIRNMGIKVNLWTSKVSVRNHNIIDTGQFEDIVEIESAGGGMLMYKREMLDKVGWFDERMFLSFEDLDWCYKLRKLGYRILQTPYAKIYHIKDMSKNISSFSLYHVLRSKMIFMRKNAGFRNIFFIPLQFFFILPYYVLRYIIKGQFNHAWHAIKATFAGWFSPYIMAYDKDFHQFDFYKKYTNVVKPRYP